jgi:hypothetical protein
MWGGTPFTSSQDFTPFFQNNILEKKSSRRYFCAKNSNSFSLPSFSESTNFKNVMLEVNNLNKSYENFSLKDVTTFLQLITTV